MVKRNYKAWNVASEQIHNRLSDAEKLHHFARYGILSPSGHNSQPWKLEIKDNSLFVSINERRHLSSDGSGLLSVEPYVSIGAFIETTVLAAKAYGYRLVIDTFPYPGYIAKITVSDNVETEPLLLDAIVSRCSNRYPFRQTAIERKILDAICSAEFTNVTKTIITNREDIEFMADMSMHGTKSIMGQKTYRVELSRWVRTNLTRKYEGMPGFTHGITGPKSLAAKQAVRYISNQKPLIKNIRNLVSKSAALVIVRCNENDPKAFINAGRQYAHLCVMASTNGLASSAVGASVLDPASKKAVCERFAILDRPVFVLRLGKPTKIPKHSPRLPLEAVMIPGDA